MSHCPPDTCETCSARIPVLEKLGIRMSGWDYVVALAGNPNTGKSTVFNQLTGLRQHTGNWPGKTVARAEGGFSLDKKRYKLVDLPGTYSLLSTSTDERIARDFVLFGQPDVVVIVVDATSLERNLNLAMQILQISNRVVICLNLMDEAKAHGIEVDHRGLAADLGVPVIPCVARNGDGIQDLLNAVRDVATGTFKCNPPKLELDVPGLSGAVEAVATDIRSLYPEVPNPEWIALQILDGDATFLEAIATGTLGKLAEDPHATHVAAAS
ncbi:MAG: FeoB small GTPase domain-containing protein [Puniceicoccaceae bacterium]